MSMEIETEGGIRSIAINCPETRNGLSIKVMGEISRALRDADGDESVRAVLIRGLPSIFSSGPGISDIKEGRDEEALLASRDMIEAADGISKPLLAAVNGPAVGVAVELLLACDLVYCGRQSLFSLPFTALGDVPPPGLTHRLVLSCGPRAAAEKLLLSEPITAGEAAAMGIVTRVFEDDAVLRETTMRAVRLTRLPPEALRRSKVLLKAASDRSIAKQMEIGAEAVRQQRREPERTQAIAAFLEGRRPDFSPQKTGQSG